MQFGVSEKSMSALFAHSVPPSLYFDAISRMAYVRRIALRSFLVAVWVDLVQRFLIVFESNDTNLAVAKELLARFSRCADRDEEQGIVT